MSPVCRNSLTLPLIVSLLVLLLPGCSGLLLSGDFGPFSVPPREKAADGDLSTPPAQPTPPRAGRAASVSPPAALPAAPDDPSGGTSATPPPPAPIRMPVLSSGTTSYENATLTEDTSWSGTVSVRGYLVVAPQATLRIEPGTVVRFTRSPIFRQLPRLVVMGRVECAGSARQPVLFTAVEPAPSREGWGGLLLLSSEKRNLLEHVRIENALTAIEARFSSLTLSDAAIGRARTGVLLRDSDARLTRVTVEGCENGLEAADSELEVRNGLFAGNQRAIMATRTTLVLRSTTVNTSAELGIAADDCRIRFLSCDVSRNGSGARIRRGEGEVAGTRFVGNRQVALELGASRLKISRSLFADTAGDGLRTDSGQSVVWECSFEGNGGHNLVNGGGEAVTALRNWWGSSREKAVLDKLLDATQDPRRGRIDIFPWLPERPAAVP